MKDTQLLRCSKCGEEKHTSYFRSRTTTGTRGYRSECKACGALYKDSRRLEINAKNRQRHRDDPGPYRERRRKSQASFRAWLNEQKNKPCLDCNTSFPPYVMDFDHRNKATKVFNVGKGYCYSRAAVIEEIAKCDLVCSNCHRVRTFRRKDHGAQRKPLCNVA